MMRATPARSYSPISAFPTAKHGKTARSIRAIPIIQKPPIFGGFFNRSFIDLKGKPCYNREKGQLPVLSAHFQPKVDFSPRKIRAQALALRISTASRRCHSEWREAKSNCTAAPQAESRRLFAQDDREGSFS